MKEKISVSLDKEMIRKVDAAIDGVGIRNRSQALEHLVRKALEKRKISRAVILAGGDMEKLRAWKTFKPLVRVDGKEVIRHCIESLKKYGISDVIISSSITKQISDVVGDDKITYVKDRSLGTAGAVRQLEKYIDGDFFVILGDIYFDFDLEKMIAFHNSHDELVTLAVSTTKLHESKDRLELEGDKVIMFDYIPRLRTYMVNAGIYIFRKGIMNYLPRRGSIEKDVFPKLAKEGKIVAYNFSGKWKHIV